VYVEAILLNLLANLVLVDIVTVRLEDERGEELR
jgi:hypothetical protein